MQALKRLIKFISCDFFFLLGAPEREMNTSQVKGMWLDRRKVQNAQEGEEDRDDWRGHLGNTIKIDQSVSVRERCESRTDKIALLNLKVQSVSTFITVGKTCQLIEGKETERCATVPTPTQNVIKIIQILYFTLCMLLCLSTYI